MDGLDLDRIARLQERLGRPARTRTTQVKATGAAFAVRSQGIKVQRGQAAERVSDARARAEALKKVYGRQAR